MSTEEQPLALFEPNVESAIEWIGRHPFPEDIDVGVHVDWTRMPNDESKWCLSFVVEGHYAFEREADSLAQLWLEAAAYYASDASRYPNGCDGRCANASVSAASMTPEDTP